MQNKSGFLCYLIGDDPLLVKCAEILLNKGHRVLGVICPLDAAKSMADANHIQYFSSLSDATPVLLGLEFDYLFSIINGTILPKTILERARHLSINFHNAPLPRYAGVHALSWALINNESEHGVTWHVMSEHIDGGDILKQALFPINIQETALSLSLKCYAQALSSFNELIDELSDSTYVRTPQDLTHSSYYSFKRKPQGNGWIDWKSHALGIMRMVHALELGHYHHNRLATPKIQIGQNIYIIGRLHVRDEVSNQEPGTLISLNAHAWHVSTNTHVVSLEQLINLDGSPCQLSTLVEMHQLREGSILPSPTLLQLTQFHTACEQSAPKELFWVNELSKFKTATLPFQPQNDEKYNSDNLIPLSHFTLSEELSLQSNTFMPPNCGVSDMLLATLLIYLYRLGNKESGLWIHDSQKQDVPCELAVFFSYFVPFSLPLEQGLSYYDVISQARDMRDTLEKKGSFLHDVFYRYPELAHIEKNHYPLALFIGTDAQCYLKPKKTTASILITISSESNVITWWIKEPLKHEEANLVWYIENISKHFKHLLDNAAATIHYSIDELTLIDNKERSLMLAMGIPNPSPYPRDKTIVQIFEDQMKRTPNNCAVVYEKKSLSYQELNNKANQLARCLRNKGLLPNTYAAICTTQELHLIIGILAILKAGAAYIPIDASYPKHHIHSILDDSKPTLLLASHHLNQRIEHDCAHLNIPILLFDVLTDWMEKESQSNLKEVEISPLSLAYIIYTSGTTGKPKGVMVPHRAVNRLVKNTNYIEIDAHDKVAQAASISFDAATFEIWGALLNGATLVAAPHATLLDPDKFAFFLEHKNITVLWLTSALFNQYAAHNPSMFRHLKALLVGGDVLNKEQIMSVINCKDGAPSFVINGYGPTENTTFTTTYRITFTDEQYKTMPIGRPIANTSVYVLDERLQPVPVGVIGELYTGGDGIAKGYLNRPELTQAKFIPDPFSPNKLYKTGDSVRWMPNKTIEYLGRQDNQIKIRGFRVELEAVQAHLLHHPAISQCCVVAKESNTHTKVLVAFIICTEVVKDIEIHNFLKNQLPNYMIPSFFVRLEKLPLTQNGKVNYKKLPKINLNQLPSSNDYTAPETATEHLLVNLWRSLLGCPTIGVEDNFFNLGGHSLLLTQLILRVKQQHQTDLPLHEFLENPTIRHLGNLVSGYKSQASKAPAQNMLVDRFLPKDLHIAKSTLRTHEQNNILLTGASGFLGAHLLHSLYQNSNSKIFCLIRENNKDSAIKRLNTTLKKYQFDLQCNERIIPVLGDLSSPYLGISPAQFATLSETIDVIFHNGASVNHLFHYEQLRAVNVNSTLEIIAFAMKNKVKPIHFISTLSAASHFLDESHCIIEDFMNANSPLTPPGDGYSQTKWVSEQLLSEAAHRGLMINIYRPGWIVGQTKTGAINAESNHLLMLLKGCIQLQVAPNWHMMLDMLPVDTISNVIIETALHSQKYNTVFNLINPNKISWTQLIHYINERGYVVPLIEPLKWKHEHLQYINDDNALYSLYPLYINERDEDWMKGLSAISRANSYNTNNAFNEAGQKMPTLNKHLLDVYFDFLEKEGFIKPPHLH